MSDFMNTGLIILLLLAGTALGFEIPYIAKKIAFYKYRKKNLVFTSDPRFSAPLIKIGLSVLNGTVWSLSVLFAENYWSAILISFLFTTAVLVAVIDIQIRIIPNELVMVMIALGIVFQTVQFSFMAILTSLLCMAAMVILFTAVAGFIGMDKVGAGDVKLAGAMGLALGYPSIVTALIVMSAVFLVYSVGGLMLRKLTLKSMLPFAPFMMSGMVFALAYMIKG